MNLYIVVLVSPIQDVFALKGEQEGVVLMGSGSISQLGRWCHIGVLFIYLFLCN